MPDVKWIHITTDMFDDEKITVIESMPESDTIIVIWVKLICLAGKCNDNGNIYLSKTIQYTDETLAKVMHRELNTVRLALTTFSKMGMIEWENGKQLFVTNFEKHQDLVGLEAIREHARLRQQKHRLLLKSDNSGNNSNINNSCVSRDSNTLVTNVTPLEERRGEEIREDYISSSTDGENIFKFYENNFLLLTNHSSDTLKDFEKEYTPLWVLDALKEAVKYNKRSLAYVQAILEDWKAKGRNNGKHKDNITASNRTGKDYTGRDHQPSNEDYERSIRERTL